MRARDLLAQHRCLIALACVLALSGCERWRLRPPPPAQVERGEGAPAQRAQEPARDR